ncbi:hypothetical protein ACFFJY_16510 [Fictibacillus aquaticus]|uniref:Uncharacterized protein n=1 Tax=Fictibacillus aquaticus TaxID=2021314 RepID=A0A235F6T3_9BACL|nr:hypothetical protein [Fictibacillus aquaticus]OYD56908.1 hypothetical protein CGZ90_15260 [Fictibacillus aquaticus]
MKRAESLEEIEQWTSSQSSGGTMLLAQNEKQPGGVVFSDEDSSQPPTEIKMKLLIQASGDSLYFEHTFNSNSEYEEAQELIGRLKEKFQLKNVTEDDIHAKTGSQ